MEYKGVPITQKDGRFLAELYGVKIDAIDMQIMERVIDNMDRFEESEQAAGNHNPKPRVTTGGNDVAALEAKIAWLEGRAPLPQEVTDGT